MEQGLGQFAGAEVLAALVEGQEGCAWGIPGQEADLDDQVVAAAARAAGCECDGAEGRCLDCCLELFQQHLHMYCKHSQI